MLVMTPAATVPSKCVRDNALGAKGAFAEEGSFAKEGNFDAVGDFAEGWRLCPRDIGRGARATAPARLRRNDVLRAVPLGNNACGSNQSDNVSAMPERDTGNDTIDNFAKEGDFAEDDGFATTGNFAKDGSFFKYGNFSAGILFAVGERLCREGQLRRVGRPCRWRRHRRKQQSSPTTATI
jgi:hypothetical protein